MRTGIATLAGGVLVGLLALAGCAPVERPPEGPTAALEDPGLGLRSGYRASDDPCRTTSETPLTMDLLDHTADLVACPTGDASIADLIARYGGRQVGAAGAFTLYSVPRG